MPHLFKGFEPKEGEYVAYLGVHVLSWPWDSGVEPKIAFTDDIDPVYEAAPDLLDALETLTATLEFIQKNDPCLQDNVVTPGEIAKARAAIQKAKA